MGGQLHLLQRAFTPKCLLKHRSRAPAAWEGDKGGEHRPSWGCGKSEAAAAVAALSTARTTGGQAGRQPLKTSAHDRPLARRLNGSLSVCPRPRPLARRRQDREQRGRMNAGRCPLSRGRRARGVQAAGCRSCPPPLSTPPPRLNGSQPECHIFLFFSWGRHLPRR